MRMSIRSGPTCAWLLIVLAIVLSVQGPSAAPPGGRGTSGDPEISVNSSVPAQKSAALLELYRVEQESWLEYIQRFQSYQPDTGFDVSFYYLSIDIALDSQYIQGDLICRFTVTENDLSIIKLDLNGSLTVDSITGNAVAYSHEFDEIAMQLDRPYSPGEIAEVRIFYQGVPQLVSETKGLRYETHGLGEPVIASLSTPFLAHMWWPCKDGPGDKPDSVYVDITIPDTTIQGLPLIAVSNGTLDNIITAGGRKTFQWRERYPIVTYYVMVAVSNFVHFGETYIGNWGETFPLDYYAFAQDTGVSRLGVERVPEVMTFFSERFGRYPFRTEKYAITELGFYGGIENQTNTVQGSMEPAWFGVTVHELVHMWFGDMITCRDWHHGWLNEGFAEYCEALWTEFDEGTAAYHEDMAAIEWTTGGTLYLDDISDPMNIFIGIIYYKGAWVLHMLRHVLGEEVFFEAMYQYATDPEFMYDHATTEQFRDLCESVSGRDLDWFFDEWVYGEYYPRYRFSYLFEEDPGGGWNAYLHLRQTQSTSPQVFTMPVDVVINTTGAGDTVSVFNNRRRQNYEFHHDNEITSFTIDPRRWILRSTQWEAYGFHIVTDTLAAAVRAEYFADTVVAKGGSGEYACVLSSGELPTGWILDPATCEISGITLDTGTVAFTIKAADIVYTSYKDSMDYSVTLAEPAPRPGDANCDGTVDVGDAVFIINYVFRQGTPPPVPNWADVNADCAVNVGDAVYLINYIFKQGDPPQPGCVN